MSTVKRILGNILIFIGSIVALAVGGVSILLGNSVRWMFKTWNHLTMDELMYQLNAPIEGTNTEMIREYINFCIPSTIIGILAILMVIIVLRRKKVICGMLLMGVTATSVIYAGYSAKVVWERLDIENYSKNKSTLSYFIDTNYVDARDVELTFPEEKRNLVYLFLESMETTYADKENGGAFEEDYIPELTELAQENEDFSGNDSQINGAYTMPGATWTMGGMFAQTSGLPLDIPIHGLNMDTQEHFFPELVTIGDILNQEGYQQTLFIGSDAAFAGRKLYFTEHGKYDMKDYYYAIGQKRIPEDYYVWWGYEDKYLFEDAKKELTELAGKDQPFNFTMLTVDTHFEDGYVCTDCGTTFGENQYANVMACSSAKVMEFVRWIQQQDFYENTTIVISGDHLTMDGDFCKDIGDYERKVYTTYINSAVEVENPEWKRSFTTFDQYPTTLASLGVTIEGNRLGLGTNLFSAEKTLAERCGSEQLRGELNKESNFMNELAESIDLNDEELLRREGKLPVADVIVLDYNYELGILPVVISNFDHIEDGISSINVAVWTESDQSDVQWMQAEPQGDGSYVMNINVPEFEFKTGIYYIDVYLVDQQGEQQLLGSAQGYVE